MTTLEDIVEQGDSHGDNLEGHLNKQDSHGWQPWRTLNKGDSQYSELSLKLPATVLLPHNSSMIPWGRGEEEEEEDIQGPHHLAVKYVTASFLSSAQTQHQLIERKLLYIQGWLLQALNLWTIDLGCPSKLRCVSKTLNLTHLAVKNKIKKKKKIDVPENISRGNHFTAPDQNPKITDTEFLLHWSKNQIMFLLKNVKKKQ